MSSIFRLKAGARAIGVAAVLATSTPFAQEERTLSGQWVINTNLSSAPGGGFDPAVDGREGGRGSGRRGGVGRRGGPTGGPGGGFGGGGFGRFGGRGGPDGGARPVSEEERVRLQALTREVLTLPARFTLIQSESALRILEPDGVARTYAINGKSEKHQLTNGTITTKTSLSNGAVVMELEAGERLKIRRSFRLRDEGRPRQLEVTTGPASGPRETGRVTVYDTVE